MKATKYFCLLALGNSPRTGGRYSGASPPGWQAAHAERIVNGRYQPLSRASSECRHSNRIEVYRARIPQA
jgi:hypothetical protein